MTAEVGESVLTSVVWNWGAYYTAAVQNVIDGTWTPGVHVEDYFGSMADGLLSITALSSEVAEGTQEAVDVAKAAIEDGSFDVFTGTYTDAAGNTVGCCLFYTSSAPPYHPGPESPAQQSPHRRFPAQTELFRFLGLPLCRWYFPEPAPPE